MNIGEFIRNSANQGKKLLAVLIDPDKTEQLEEVISHSEIRTDLYLIGGSLITNGNLKACIDSVRKITKKPLVLFPGSQQQIEPSADAIFLLSLVSGRNPDLLIGQHVEASFRLKKSGLEILPVGYILVDSGKINTAIYMSQTLPIPGDKDEIAAATALAAEQLGMQLVYLDGGSGAAGVVSSSMISSVKKEIQVPLVVGGGIRSRREIELAWNSGADLVVVGSVVEENPAFISQIFG